MRTYTKVTVEFEEDGQKKLQVLEGGHAQLWVAWINERTSPFPSVLDMPMPDVLKWRVENRLT